MKVFTLTMYDSWGDGWTGNELLYSMDTNTFTFTEMDARNGLFAV